MRNNIKIKNCLLLYLRKLEFAAGGGLGEGREQVLGSCQPEKRLNHNATFFYNPKGIANENETGTNRSIW